MDYIANKLLPFVYENREYLKTLHTATVAKSFEDTIIVSFTDWAIDIIRPQSETFNLPKDVLTKIIVEQIVVIIKTWLLQEAPMPPKEFKEDFLQITKSSLYSSYTVNSTKVWENLRLFISYFFSKIIYKIFIYYAWLSIFFDL